MIQTIHARVEGRTRFRVSGLYRCEGLRAHLTAGLEQHAAILSVSASVLTGNVLVHYRTGNTPRGIAAILAAVADGYRARDPASHSTANPGMPAAKARTCCPPADVVVTGLRALRGRVSKFLQHTTPQHRDPWHVRDAAHVLETFESSLSCGLSSRVARERLSTYGANLLPEAAPRSAFALFADQFKSLPVALLGVAAGLSLATGGLADAMVIASVVAINGVIGFVTEREVERTIQSLKNLIQPCVEVLRDGSISQVTPEQLVPGDIFLVHPGSYIGADGRLIEAQHLSVDESVLTGESLPAGKTPETLARAETAIGDRTNMLYMGTVVTGGQGLALVVATGRYTEVGQLQTLLATAISPDTPLERQLQRLGSQLVAISGATCAFIFLLGLLRGYGFLKMLKNSISLAVAAVPEGLPAVATTTFALGVRNMRQHGVLIRRLAAVETLGAVQTMCFDKTGTVTLNRMSAVTVFCAGRRVQLASDNGTDAFAAPDVSGDRDLRRLVEICVLCNEAQALREGDAIILRGSPTEKALIHLALKASVDVIGLRETYPLIRTTYRSEQRLFMATYHRKPGEGTLLAVKGSPPEVLALCRWQWRDGAFHPLDDEDRAHIEGENERMAADALRVLGVASCEDVELKGDDPENGCVWLGLVGMADPVRHGVKALINRFQRAGINTVMITGDQGPTAYAVGKELDLSCGRQLEILEATHLTRMDQEVLAALAAKVHIFARVSPAHKLQIVRALQSGGRVVAMAGDGINDGPALKAADIGIAMGNGGTEIAREVADVVLEEDNLESMIIAVRDGRTIYRNIRKSLHFLLSTNFSEIMVMLVAVAAGLGAPLNAMQLLWINLISDIFPGLALALEPPEPDVLEQPSRPPDEPIVKSADFRRLAFESSMLSAGAMGAYGYGLLRLGADAHAGTLAFQSLTLGQLLHAWSCRSEDHSIFSSPHLPPNRPLSLALGTSFALQGLTILLPRLRALLGLAPIGLADGAVIMGSALLPFVINEATKNTSQGDSQ